jgi:hypothetical protein
MLSPAAAKAKLRESLLSTRSLDCSSYIRLPMVLSDPIHVIASFGRG